MKSISLDTETTGLDLFHICRPFFVSVCDGSQSVFWRWDVDPKTRKVIVPPGDLEEIADVVNEADEVVFQNAKYDIRGLEVSGLPWRKEWWDKIQETLYSGHLLASGENLDLTTQALRWLRFDIKPAEDRLQEAVTECRGIVRNEFKDWRIAKKGDPDLPSAKGSGEDSKLWKWDMWLPWVVAEVKGYPEDHPYRKAVPDYSNLDTSVTLPLWEVHRKYIEQRKLWDLYLERRKLVRIIYEMEARGVTVNLERLESLRAEYSRQSQEDEKACVELSDGLLDSLPKSGTTKAMRVLLFDEFQLPVLKESEKTGEPSVSAEVLEEWEGMLDSKTETILGVQQGADGKPYKFIKRLRNKRKRDTSVNYMDSYKRFGIPVRDRRGNPLPFIRLHPSLNATGSDTLRFSSSNPNEQNISKQKDESGKNIRWCFGPLPGREWWSLDYENLELRIPAYEAGEQEMIELFERPDDPPYFGSVHLLMFDTLHPEMFAEHGADVKKIFKDTWYQWTKNGDFAVQYGAMEESGTADRAYHVPGAQRRIQQRFQKIADLNRSQINFAQQHGYVYTAVDRELGAYPIQTPTTKWGRVRPTVPLNYHVQSTAMWCMCRAMIRCWNYLQDLPDHYIIMQVHDELVFDFPRSIKPGGNIRKVLELKRLMEMSGNDIGIPLKVDCSYHPHNWSEHAEVGVVAA